MKANIIRSAFIIILLSPVFFGCNDRIKTPDELITIDLIEATKSVKQLNLSELVDDVEYVKFETTEESAFGIARFLVTQNYIVVFERYEGTVRLFSRQGKYLRQIGRKGQGPGEFYRISDVIVFPAEDYLIIHDGGFQKIIKYKITGEFILEEPVPRSERQLASISLLGDDRFALLFHRPTLKTENFSLIQIRDKNFQTIDSLFQVSTPLIENSFGANGFSLYIKNDIMHFREGFYDTLYAYKNKAFIPEYHFLIKDNKQPSFARNYNDRNVKYNRIGSQFALGDYILCEFETPGEEQDQILSDWVVYNQSTKDIFTLPEHRLYHWGTSTGPAIFNDIDGIHHINMSTSVNVLVTHFTENLIYKAIDIIDLKTFIQEEHHKNRVVKLPDRQQELINLVEQSTLEDNPILQIFHLK